MPSAPGRTVSVRLPTAPAEGVQASLLHAAERFEVRIADHAWPVRESSEEEGRLAVGVNPAAVLMAGEDPASIAARLGDRLASVRLSDLDSGGNPVAPGRGRLDVEAFIAAVSVVGWTGPLVVDLRGISTPESAMVDVIERWRASP